MARSRPRRGRKRRIWRWLLGLLVLGLVAAGAAIGAFVLYVQHLTRDLPPVFRYEDYLASATQCSYVLAADGFAGEKERKTLEALLYTPISEVELFVAKLLTGFIPSMIVSLGAFVVYGIVVNLSGYPTVGRIFFPTASWWPLVFWLGPGVALVGLGATVLISSKAKSAVQAQQVSGILVMPIVFLMIAQISGLFYLGTTLVILIGLAAWILGLWLIWIGARTFARNELIAGS